MAPKWQKTATLVIPAASVGFGFFVFIFSCVYTFGVVGLQTTWMSEYMKNCKDYGKRRQDCIYIDAEMAGGIIGFLFGLIQIGIGAAMFITKDKTQLYKVWAAVNSILLAFILTAGVLPLHIYTTYPSCDIQRSQLSCNQFTISAANGLIVVYGIIAILDAIFIFVSVVALAMMHQAASDSPSGYQPPSSAASVEARPSNQLQKGSVTKTSQSHTLKVPPSPKISKTARPPG